MLFCANRIWCGKEFLVFRVCADYLEFRNAARLTGNFRRQLWQQQK